MIVEIFVYTIIGSMVTYVTINYYNDINNYSL